MLRSNIYDKDKFARPMLGLRKFTRGVMPHRGSLYTYEPSFDWAAAATAPNGTNTSNTSMPNGTSFFDAAVLGSGGGLAGNKRAQAYTEHNVQDNLFRSSTPVIWYITVFLGVVYSIILTAIVSVAYLRA